MGDVHSSLEFKSNIGIVAGNKRLIEDHDFLSYISDPFALKRLALQENGRLLNDLQRKQMEKADGCLLADAGDHPWGTQVINGIQEVVCRCEKTSCPVHEACMQRSPEAVASKNRDTVVEDGRIPHNHNTTRHRLGVEALSSPQFATGKPSSRWPDDKRAQLKALFNSYPREMVYAFFPDDSTEEIDRQIQEVCFSFTSKSQPIIRPSYVMDESTQPKTRAQRSKQLTSKNKVDRRDARRNAWADDMIDSYYDLYGPNWRQWRWIVPWMKGSQLHQRAKELGHSGGWTKQERLDFLATEGLDWSLKELDTLIQGYPIRKEDSRDWEILLKGRNKADRVDLAELLNLPSQSTITELYIRASTL